MSLLGLRSCAMLCWVASVVSDSLYWSPPGSYVHGMLQATILEWAAIASFRGTPHPGIKPHLLCLLRWQGDSLPLSHPPEKAVLDLSHMIFFHCVFSSLMHGFVSFSFELSLVFSVQSLIWLKILGYKFNIWLAWGENTLQFLHL